MEDKISPIGAFQIEKGKIQPRVVKVIQNK
jgi:hypothetical protein